LINVAWVVVPPYPQYIEEFNESLDEGKPNFQPLPKGELMARLEEGQFDEDEEETVPACLLAACLLADCVVRYKVAQTLEFIESSIGRFKNGTPFSSNNVDKERSGTNMLANMLGPGMDDGDDDDVEANDEPMYRPGSSYAS
jgi:hypothetical protein